MPELDILAALDATPARGVGRCPTAAFIDAIPADAPGRDELVRLFETPHDRNAAPATRSARDMARILTTLGYPVTSNTVIAHRNRACACFR